MDSGLEVLIIGAVMAVATTVQTMLNNRAAAKRQEADWERQDQVAQHAQKTSELLVNTNTQIAAEAKKASLALIESGRNIQSNVEVVREIAANTQGLASATHGLLNGDFTRIKQMLLAALELVLHRDRLTPEKIKETQQQIDELRHELNTPDP